MARTVGVMDVLTEKDFDYIWDYLETKFGYNKQWRHECKKYVHDRQKLISYKPDPVGDFLFFCKREVQPLLNAALCRRPEHPTFMRMMFWLYQDRIQAKNRGEK